MLAAYLRTLALVGVGLYTHPRTQYVHLDIRDESYHWIDGSPPGVTWREQQLLDWTRWKKDPSYTPEMDLPVVAMDKPAEVADYHSRTLNCRVAWCVQARGQFW